MRCPRLKARPGQLDLHELENVDKQGGCSRPRTGLQGPSSRRPWDTWPGKALRWAAAPRALDNSGHKGEEVPRPLPNGSSTSDSSVTGEGSPGRGSESPTSQDGCLQWIMGGLRGVPGECSWRSTWEGGQGGRGLDEGGCAFGSGLRRGQSDRAGVGSRC